MVFGLGFRVQGPGFRVQGSGFRSGVLARDLGFNLESGQLLRGISSPAGLALVASAPKV
jgi:hypothetical protein